jgi:hypothetical protein
MTHALLSDSKMSSPLAQSYKHIPIMLELVKKGTFWDISLGLNIKGPYRIVTDFCTVKNVAKSEVSLDKHRR